MDARYVDLNPRIDYGIIGGTPTKPVGIGQIQSGGMILDPNSAHRFSYNPTRTTRFLTPPNRIRLSRKPVARKVKKATPLQNVSKFLNVKETEVKKAGMYGSIGALMVIATASLVWIAAKKQ